MLALVDIPDGQDISGVVTQPASEGSGPSEGVCVIALADQAWALGRTRRLDYPHRSPAQGSSLAGRDHGNRN
ncbi:hypothetical protein BH18ACT10_BH18ACT10_05140 [soil metagenome]|nr:hypothetical protein [Rubrobacter sp.]